MHGPEAHARRPAAVAVRRAVPAGRRRDPGLGRAATGHHHRPRPLPPRGPRRPAGPGRRARASAGGPRRIGTARAPRPAARGRVLRRAGGRRDDPRRVAVAGRCARAVADGVAGSPAEARPAAGGARAVADRDPRGLPGPRPEPGLTGRAAAHVAERGPAGERHPVVDPRAARSPRCPGPARVQEVVATAPGQRLELAGELGARRPVPVVLPARRCGDRAVGVERWASNGGGALSVPTQVRAAAVADDGWRFVVADVAQLEPRVLARMSADTAMAEAARSADLYQGMVARGAGATPAEAQAGKLGAVDGRHPGRSR